MTRLGFKAMSLVTPPFAARLVEREFFTPPHPPLAAGERAVLSTARRTEVPFRGGRISAWSWGRGSPVFLMHGWGGRGAQLGAFVEPLLVEGHRVVTFDAPGHGASSPAKTNLFEMADALERVVAYFGVAKGVIAHSLGAAATTLAVARGLPVERLVFVAPSTDPIAYFRRYLEQLGVAEESRSYIEWELARRSGKNWEELDLLGAARAMTHPLLVLHDRDDRDVPLGVAEDIARAWPGAGLVTTSGFGHRRILKDRAVIARVVDFVTRPSPRGGAHADSELTAAESLDRDLFERDHRRTQSS